MRPCPQPQRKKRKEPWVLLIIDEKPTSFFWIQFKILYHISFCIISSHDASGLRLYLTLIFIWTNNLKIWIVFHWMDPDIAHFCFYCHSLWIRMWEKLCFTYHMTSIHTLWVDTSVWSQAALKKVITLCHTYQHNSCHDFGVFAPFTVFTKVCVSSKKYLSICLIPPYVFIKSMHLCVFMCKIYH